MAIEFLREKLNVLGNLLQQSELELFQLQLHVEVAAGSSGDPQVDANLGATAQNAKAQILACNRKLVVYREKYKMYKAELDAAGPAPT